jgi:Raf kinase inhibitor-like YbhB/YbcL family protein
MILTSAAFADNDTIPQKYTCEGEGINPPLEFFDIPKAAKSLALIVEDPDAVSKKPWIHWVLFNISPNVQFIKEGTKPGNSQEGVADSGENGYGAVCPPQGTGVHRYEFRLYALDEKLDDMPEFTDKEMLLEAMHGHVIDQALLTGLYQNTVDINV